MELWFAMKTRVAAINPAIPISYLWKVPHKLFDAELAAAVPEQPQQLGMQQMQSMFMLMIQQFGRQMQQADYCEVERALS